MASHFIEDLPLNIRNELEDALDNHPSVNWRALIQLMPSNWYQSNHVEGFAMETLQPNGSPTRALLNDLSLRHVTVQQLVVWLRQLTKQGHYSRLQSVLMRLQGMNEHLTITRQPDDLYKYPAGSSLYIKCEGSPCDAVSYQWFKRKVPLQGKTQPYLHLQKVTKEDAGFYICRMAVNEQCLFTNWAKLEIMESSPEMAKPIITTQPECLANQSVLGGVLHLYCDAVGDPAPQFQWYKDDIPIVGATGREYNKANLCLDDEGVYLCVASNSAGHAFSDRTTVTVGKNTNNDAQNISRGNIGRGIVSDKVALLIGNKEYMDHRLGTLYHPTNDVCDLAGALRSIGFKVVSLVNLTLAEMRFAVRQFYQMLDKDMYALFYFAGHGFEVGNQSYLMPVDASRRYLPEENLSASEVIKPMQNTQAKLNIVLLDSCRTRPSESHVNPTEGLEVKKKNVIIVFPCCSKNSVFESESQTNGYFAIYLLKHIGDEKTISDVILNVSAGIDREDIRDPYTSQKQIVYTHSTMTEQLSLRAPVDHDALSMKTTEGWKAAHEIPETPVPVFRDGDCVVELLFFAEFSNVLLVHARLQGGDDSAVTFILEPGIYKAGEERNGCVFERVNEKDPTFPVRFPRSNCLTQAIRVKNLQRLQGDLMLSVEVNLASETCTRLVHYRMEAKPLYAKII